MTQHTEKDHSEGGPGLPIQPTETPPLLGCGWIWRDKIIDKLSEALNHQDTQGRLKLLREARHQVDILISAEHQETAGDLSTCSLCSVEFSQTQEGGVIGTIGTFITVRFCPTCLGGIQDMVEEMAFTEPQEVEDFTTVIRDIIENLETLKMAVPGLWKSAYTEGQADTTNAILDPEGETDR